jgi:hypothetical protein
MSSPLALDRAAKDSKQRRDFEQRPAGLPRTPGSNPRVAASQAAKTAMLWLAQPFDSLRWLYAAAVRAGWLRRSMLANRDFERTLGACERLTLGVWARRV